MGTKKSNWQSFKDTLFFPIRSLYPNNERFHFLELTPLSNERFQVALQACCGKLLDMGCANNQLVSQYQRFGLGVDTPVYLDDRVKPDVWIAPYTQLPFRDGIFNTVAFIASLNHITDRKQALLEAYRVLSDHGRVVITMLDPFLGDLGHKLWAVLGSDPDQHRRGGMSSQEIGGLSKQTIFNLLRQSGFSNARHFRFSFGFNNIYVAEKN